MSVGLDQALEPDEWPALLGSRNTRPLRAWRITPSGCIAMRSVSNPGFECVAPTLTLANDMLTKHENERAA